LLLVVLLPVQASVRAEEVPAELQKLYEQGKFETAIQKAMAEMEKYKRSEEYPYFVGTCYEKMLNFKKAEEFYRRALDLKGSHLPTLYRLGKILVQDSTKADEAKAFFEEGLKRAKKNPEKAMFEDGLGLYYLALKNYSEANKKFLTAQFLDPTDCDYPMHLGDANYEKGAYALAITSYNKVLADCDSLNAEVHFRLGRSYLTQKKYSESLQGLGNAIRLDSAYVEAYKLAGKIFILAAMSAQNDQALAVENYKNGIWMFRKYIELTDETGEANYYLAKAYGALGYQDSASAHFNAAVEAGYARTDLLLDQGRSLVKSGQYDQAVEAFNSYEQGLLLEDPNYTWTAEDAPLFVERARAYSAIKDSLSLVKASADYGRAWSLDSTDVSLLSDIGFNYYYLGKFDSTYYWNALNFFERKISIDSTNEKSWLNAAYALMRLKDWDKTAQYLKKATEINPTNCSVNKMIASSLSQQKKFTESREYYRKWAECDSVSYEPEKWIGFTYLTSTPPDSKSALPHLLKASEKLVASGTPECEDVDLATWIAQAYALEKKYSDSMNWIKRGLKCDPTSKTLTELKNSVAEAQEEL
jgi:tetratricopeptide (TPR) repeat protein